LTQTAWQAIEEKVRAGAVLLVTGPFDEDAHLTVTGRQDAVGLPHKTDPLTIRHEMISFPGGDEALSFTENKTTVLSRATLPDGQDWIEKPFGKGKILLATLPLELNDNVQAIGDVYVYALKTAGVVPIYTTALKDPGILICPTLYPDATLYVLASESNQTQVNFKDARSGRSFGATKNSISKPLVRTLHWTLLARYSGVLDVGILH
jgi:hypothetical protein